MLPCLIINGIFRAIFYCVEILDCIGFALLRSVIGPENSCHFLNQSNAKLKPITNWSSAVFPRFMQFGCFYFEFIIGSQRYFSFLLIGRWLLWFWFLRRLIDKSSIGIDPWLGILLRWLLALYVSLLQCHALINDGSLALCTASEQCNLVYLKNTLFEGLYILLVKLNINPLNPKSDQRLISPYNLTGESFFKIMRKKGSDHQPKKLWLLRILLVSTIRNIDKSRENM